MKAIWVLEWLTYSHSFWPEWACQMCLLWPCLLWTVIAIISREKGTYLCVLNEDSPLTAHLRAITRHSGAYLKDQAPPIHLGLSPWNCYLGWEELSTWFSWKYFSGGCYYLGSRVAQPKDRIISMETQPLTVRPLLFPSLHCISLQIIMTLALQNGCGD